MQTTRRDIQEECRHSEDALRGGRGIEGGGGRDRKRKQGIRTGRDGERRSEQGPTGYPELPHDSGHLVH